MRPAAFALAAILVLPCAGTRSNAQNLSVLMSNDQEHNTAEWANISEHLPNLDTAPPSSLELAGDVLRARRYGPDALRYYNAALEHGGDRHILLKKMGVTCLELQQPMLARMFFQKSIKANKKDAVAWNDLGAADFTLQSNRSAVSDYKRALKLNRNSAVFHSNLALVYFQMDDVESARHELARAVELDPDILHKRDEHGYSAQVLATTRYGEICFEMARIYATQGNIDAMLDWLTKASDRGYDVHEAMDRDPILRPLLSDKRVQLIIKNTRLLRAGNKSPANIPSLGDAPK